MNTRKKIFLAAPLVAGATAALISGEPKIFIFMSMLYALTWLAWRGVLFLYLLFKPVREVLKPYVEPVNQSAEDALRSLGLGKIADASEKMRADLDAAVAKKNK